MDKKNLLATMKDAIVSPRFTAILVPYDGGVLIRCYIKDTDIKVGDLVTLAQYANGALALIEATQDMAHVVVKEGGRIPFDKKVLTVISTTLKMDLPALSKPMRVKLTKVSEKEWKLTI